MLVSCSAVYCNRSCLWVGGWAGVCVCVGGLDCYHDNSKLCALIHTKLGLYVKVVTTISSWLNFGHPAPPGRVSVVGRNFWLHLTTTSMQCLHFFERFFSLAVFTAWRLSNWSEWKIVGLSLCVIRPKKLDVALLAVMIWLEPCVTYSSSSSVVTTRRLHHPLLQ